jgi:tetratricopeptide (TPR) repeat protein
MRISLCVIARDDAEHLATLLEEMRDQVDEIVVVDTGSQDERTLEVAKQFGARTGRHEWQDSFAAARNATLELATGDWILTLDPDERFSEAVPGTMRRLVEAAPPPAEDGSHLLCICPLYRHAEDLAAGRSYVGFQPRLFPRHRLLRWVFPLYETPVLEAPGAELSFDSVANLAIVHLGHPHDEARRVAKRERNARIVAAALRETPNQPFVHYMAGREAFDRGDHAAAAAHFSRAAELVGTRPPPYMARAFLELVTALRRCSEYDRAIERGLEALHYFPQADLDCAVGLAYFLRGRPGDDEAALRHYRRARLLHTLGMPVWGDQEALTWKPLWGMAHVYQRLGQPAEALACCEEALRYAPQQVAIRQQAAALLRQLGRPAEAAAHLRAAAAALDSAVPGSTELQELNLAIASCLIEAGQLQEAYDHLAPLAASPTAPEPYRLKLADLLISAGHYAAAVETLAGALDGDTPASGAVYQRLGEALMHLQRYEDARNAFQLALSVDPGNQAARLGYDALSLQKGQPDAIS